MPALPPQPPTAHQGGRLPSAAPSTPGAASRAPTSHPGTFFLGRYRVVEEIGIGGMASVYLARMDGPGGFQKWVAIKRIHANLVEDDQFVDMFLDEARIAAGINHSNVAQVFDLGKDDNTYWIAMEYLHGEPLREIMRRCEERGQLMSADLAAKLCSDAAEGLHAAHELRGKNGQFLGLVHRDVTPHNLFITYDGYTKVVDFGIAKVADRLSETRAGTLKGKLAYMSPEQVRGQEDVDRTTDLFALGVVLWELTTGHRLFRMDTDLDTLEKVQACVVPPPSTMIPDYPVELEIVVMKALAKRKEDRFQTARDFSRALQTYLMRRGVFVGPEEVAAFIGELFGDRIKAREEHLAWAADVTSTINLDQLNAPKMPLQQIGPPGPSSQSGRPNAGPIPAEGQVRMAAASVPPGMPSHGPPSPRTVKGVPAPGSSRPSTTQAEPGHQSPAPSGRATPPPLDRVARQSQAPRSKPPVPPQSSQSSRMPPVSARATIQGISAPPLRESQGSSVPVPPQPTAIASTSLVDDDEDIPTTVAAREHYGEIVLPDYQASEPPYAYGSGPSNGSPQRSAYGMQQEATDSVVTIAGPDVLPSFAPPPGLPSSVVLRRPSQMETALSIRRPTNGVRVSDGPPRQAGRSNTLVLVLVAVITAVCVVAISVLIFLKARQSSAGATGGATHAQTGSSKRSDGAALTNLKREVSEQPTASESAMAVPSASGLPTQAAAVTLTSGPPTTAAPVTSASGSPGYLTVICRPYCDEVRRNGVPIGPSPITRRATPPGQHRISLKKAGVPDKVVSVIIVSGETQTVRQEMTN